VKRLSTALLGLAVAGTAAAQTTEYGPVILRMPTSARILAMGDIGVAGRDDDVIFYNPAQLFVARGTSFSLTRPSESTRGGTMSTVLRLGPGGVGFGVSYLEYQAPPLSYPIRPIDILGGNTVRGTSALGAVGYSQVYRGFRLGVSAKYAMDAIELERFESVFGDAGIARDFGRYSTALAVQNIGGGISRGVQEIDAPMLATLGVATSRAIGPLDVVATAGVSASEEDDVTAGGGAEVSWGWISGYSIQGRAGVHQARQGGDTEFMGGVGLIADRMAIDITAHRITDNRVAYRAGIRIR
jgi:hypothetical protein